MDAFAVSIASGAAIKRLKIRNALKIAAFFGLFQAAMPLVGWGAGLSIKHLIESVDHWVVFGLLSFVGGKMIYESIRLLPAKKAFDPLNLHMLLLLSIATSLDALAVGLSFALLKIDIALPLLVIGLVTFVLSFVGTYIGDRAGHFFENRIQAAGGIILIVIGAKVLVDHLWYHV